MALAPTVLPMAWSSNPTLGKGPLTPVLRSSGARVPSPTNCDHVSVFAGIWTTRLQGTVMVVPLRVTLPPQRLLSASVGHPSLLTVDAWMYPVTSKPRSVEGSTDHAGSGRVGVSMGEIAPCGGFAVPPFALACVAITPDPARAIRVHAASMRGPFRDGL